MRCTRQCRCSDIWDDITIKINPQRRSASATRRRNPKPSWNGSSRPVRTRATSSLTPSADAAQRSAVAQRLNRRWIGIDITHLAIGLIKKRLGDAFGESVRETYEVIGEPVDLQGRRSSRQRRPVPIPMVGAEPGGSAPARKEERRGPRHRRPPLFSRREGRQDQANYSLR